MKADRRITFVFLNIFILLGCILGGYVFSVDAQKYAGIDTVYIAPLLNHWEYNFDREDLEILENELDAGTGGTVSGAVSYEKVENKILKNGITELYTKVIYTNNVYFNINNIVFTDGGPWKSRHNKDNIVVLSEYAAWYLFGSTDVVGKTISVNDTLCEVTGITKQSDKGENLYYAWVPMDSGLGPAEGVSNLLFKDYNYNQLDSIVGAETLLDMADKKYYDYYITDLNQYANNIKIKNMAVILCLFLWVTAFSVTGIYHISAVRRNWKYSFVYFPGLIFSALGSWLVYSKIQALMWITRQPFNIKSVFEILLNRNMLPGAQYLSYHLRELAKINQHANYVFIMALICVVNIIFLTDKTIFKPGI